MGFVLGVLIGGGLAFAIYACLNVSGKESRREEQEERRRRCEKEK